MPRWIAILAAVVGIGLATSRAAVSSAQSPAGPGYTRVRPGADNWARRIDGGGVRHPGTGIGWPYYTPYLASPVQVGAWYARPYPYHFDYYRHRWDASADDAQAWIPAAGDCPCLADESIEASTP